MTENTESVTQNRAPVRAEDIEVEPIIQVPQNHLMLYAWSKVRKVDSHGFTLFGEISDRITPQRVGRDVIRYLKCHFRITAHDGVHA